MSVNSSSSSNDSLLHPHHSSTNSNLPFGMHCLTTRPGSLISTSYFITNILLLLPLCTFILYLRLQRWRQQRSTSTAAMTSHSDAFTYHMVIIELIGILSFFLSCCGIYSDHIGVLMAGHCLWTFIWFGQMFFHTLTCVERYLAVVYPITYLSLKRERGIRIRNISIGCVWLLCFGGTSLITLENASLIADLCVLSLSFFVISLCNVSVLCILIRPGPGKQGGDRERVDKSKQRAFYTMLAILGALLLRCIWNVVWFAFYIMTENGECVLMTSGLWFNLPCSLVLPLLFLHRARMLVCCKNNTK
ncbi:uncharacterized protein LOC127363544 isoform X1 [Dicentrarchus labrax]|uniref:uncharacterized protein LOC127363544 isoform X1 n=1 Tax=Dicentrarchus labrax TaxID=13489 RepID=UPI0021F5388A|nr:uncharacterized protein LOC127363544 isoform X1 [Dicentrarchus labrax]XP_051256070.1 uncharacterized protein LOC127363544 isoform X1 [Dicentrarchus labrax]XP_051256071.1 uncharacterized protein LOC127363544 isoform X1 [Dicentrarchus labrax]XP_051256072.1 uncharacterized protein LOC127363544 isoform X1 [Dicentrarchus labrax]XP_051256073.1 uncharacterized protein LOC127363544 isoform X1 [Dicentrarchus labrax]XP_051256074.1 uncharacterized protein LOC127363544 isoform X1 [Dicentrarchus labrax]